MCDIRLFRSAYTDYELAQEIYKIPRNDEAFLNATAYHLQQSVEKLLKAFLECKGVTVPNTHDIYKLVRMSKNHGSNVILNEWLEDKADMVTRWETDTKERLRSYFPKGYEPEDAFEWNCYFQIYRKQLTEKQ